MTFLANVNGFYLIGGFVVFACMFFAYCVCSMAGKETPERDVELSVGPNGMLEVRQ